MSIPILSNIINSLQDKTVKSLITCLQKESRNIFYKDELESNRLLIYLVFMEDTNHLTELERECRSVILDRRTLKVISYSMNEVYTEDKSLLNKLNSLSYKIYECIEGTLLSIYYFNDKWNVSTRRCLDAKKSFWLSSKNHYDLMLECVNDNFFEVLDKTKNYCFVLQHHENKGIVDYDKRFGNNYKRLVLLTIRDEEMNEINDNITEILKSDIKVVDEFNDLSLLTNENNLENILDGVEYEGLLIKIYDNNIKYLRLPTSRYTKKNEIMPNAQNKYISYIKLYQLGTLKENIKLFPENGFIEHRYKPIKYDTIGVVDSCFQTLVIELHNLFCLMYDLKHGEQKNKDLYNLLPASYHEILYAIKGIFFKKRIDQKLNKIKNHKLTNKDIYYLIKSYNLNQLIFLLRGRKILKDEIIKNRILDKKYQLLDNLSANCDVKQMALMSMYLDYMFN
jgi:hypothetical protein